jgi:prepilin-type N-terminal cleavage/methylation domain-containing protein
MRTKVSMNKPSGFTLSEILIALAILGVCLSVSVPMMSQSRDQSKKKVVFKETINLLYGIMREGMVTDEMDWTNLRSYYFKRVNAVKVCPTNASDPVQGCWDKLVQGNISWEADEGGVVLASGAVIIGFADGTLPSDYEGIYIDWNGKIGPNLYGDDQMWLSLCFMTNKCGAGATQLPGTIAPYDFFPYAPSNSATDVARNRQLFMDVMK